MFKYLEELDGLLREQLHHVSGMGDPKWTFWERMFVGWGFSMRMSKEEFAGHFTLPDLNMSIQVYLGTCPDTGGGKRLIVSNYGFRKSEPNRMARVLDIPGGAVYFRGSRLESQGQGTTKKLFAKQLKVFDALGLARGYLTAQKIGTYAWIKYGFRPTDGGAFAKTVFKEITRLLGDLEPDKRIDSGNLREVAATEVSVADISILKEQGTIPEGAFDMSHWINKETNGFLLGKYAILNNRSWMKTGWPGEIDMAPGSDDRSKMDKYIGG